MSEIALLIAVVFVALLLMNVPIVVAIGLLSSLAIFASGGEPLATVAGKMANGIDSFSLLAIPFFILAGLLMGRGGLARRLMELAAAVVPSQGHLLGSREKASAQAFLPCLQACRPIVLGFSSTKRTG